MTKQVLLLPTIILFILPAAAQNTGGVFPPMVNEGHKSFQYRAAIDPDNNAGETGFAQRLHYQQAIDRNFMWRIIGQSRKTVDSDTDFDFAQAELFWDLSQNDQNYRTGLRFDVRVRDNSRPNQLGINWMNQFHFGDGWSARALLLSSFQIGANAGDGINLQTRWQLAKKIANKHTLGIELYNSLGNTEDFGSLSDQSQTLGPTWVASTNSGWSFFSGILFGLTDASPDSEARVWITKSL